MVLYFTGTGNSRYVAERIAQALGDTLCSLNDRIKAGDTSPVNSDARLIIVVPTYAWRIPRIVQNWLQNARLAGNRNIYFVMTCGGSIANAGKYLEKLCAEKKMNDLGCIGITMPENYIALFSTPPREKALEIGANVIMPNITPLGNRGNYRLYENKPGMDEGAEESTRRLMESVKRSGCEIQLDTWGDSLHFQNRVKK